MDTIRHLINTFRHSLDAIKLIAHYQVMVIRLRCGTPILIFSITNIINGDQKAL